jgi:hypothetical protein
MPVLNPTQFTFTDRIELVATTINLDATKQIYVLHLTGSPEHETTVVTGSFKRHKTRDRMTEKFIIILWFSASQVLLSSSLHSTGNQACSDFTCSIHLLVYACAFIGRSQWPRGLSREPSSPAQTLGSWIQISLEAFMSVFVYSVFVLFRV